MSARSSGATGLARRFHHLSMPAEEFSITISALKAISLARNPTDKRHQLSLDHYSPVDSRLRGS